MVRIGTGAPSDGRRKLMASLRREIADLRVLEAMEAVPRERFVPKELRPFAYDDRPLPIGNGQTISQPLMVAIMTEALQLRGSEHVLEVGIGSGYQSAILSHLSAQVVGVERFSSLAERAACALADLGYDNARVFLAGDHLGWPSGAPYDAVIVTAGAPIVPPSLVDQLRENGRLVIPVGSRTLQELLRVVRTPDGPVIQKLGHCRFVPLIAREAWPEEANP